MVVGVWVELRMIVVGARVTVCVKVDDVVEAKLVSPEYVAVIAESPTANDGVQVAVSAVTGTSAHRVVAPLAKVMVPEGSTEGLPVGASVAVMVGEAGRTAGLEDVASIRPGVAGETTSMNDTVVALEPKAVASVGVKLASIVCEPMDRLLRVQTAEAAGDCGWSAQVGTDVPSRENETVPVG
jgi:hypothetical protein